MKETMQKILNEIEEVIEYYVEHELTNTQEFLDFMDSLNEISVRY